MIHSLDIAACPFEQRLAVKVEKAHRRLVTGVVDGHDFDDERSGWTAESAFAELLATRPTSEDLVFTHGDYCLPNIIINPQNWTISGFIDWGRAGVADRYQDLALVGRSLAYNFSPDWIEVLFREYGLSEIDYAKVQFYKLLDEFF
jgi:aminoglycoside phosphotransferase